MGASGSVVKLCGQALWSRSVVKLCGQAGTVASPDDQVIHQS